MTAVNGPGSGVKATNPIPLKSAPLLKRTSSRPRNRYQEAISPHMNEGSATRLRM